MRQDEGEYRRSAMNIDTYQALVMNRISTRPDLYRAIRGLFGP